MLALQRVHRIADVDACIGRDGPGLFGCLLNDRALGQFLHLCRWGEDAIRLCLRGLQRLSRLVRPELSSSVRLSLS